MTDLNFGTVQLRIMRILWERKRMSAREITAALNETAEPEIAHSTVQTLLRQLEIKGAIAHEQEDRTFIFHPLVQQEKVARNETRQLMNRLFDGSAGGLMAYLLKQESIPQKELEKIKKLIEENEERS